MKGNPDPAADNPGWFFVIQERPGEPRFGLDDLSDESPATPTNWNELAWEHLAQFESLGCVDFERERAERHGDHSAPDSQFKWGRNARGHGLHPLPGAGHGRLPCRDMLP